MVSDSSKEKNVQARADVNDVSSGLIDIKNLIPGTKQEDSGLLEVAHFSSNSFAPVTVKHPWYLHRTFLIGGSFAVLLIIIIVIALARGATREEERQARARDIALLREQIEQMQKAGSDSKEINHLQQQLVEKTAQLEAEDRAVAATSAAPKSPTAVTEKKSRTADSQLFGSTPAKTRNRPSVKANASLESVLNAAAAPPPKKPPAAAVSEAPKVATEVKASLDRNDVQVGFQKVAGKVKTCGVGATGTISMRVIIGSSGKVVSALATGSFSGTPVGECASRAVRSATFPATSKNISVQYPFTF